MTRPGRNYLFSTQPYGADHDEKGWAIWAGKMGRTAHAHLWRAKRYDGYRSLLRASLGLGKAQFSVTLVKYRPGASLPWHRDSNDWVRHCAAIFELRPARQGGVFETRGKLPYWRGTRLFIFDGIGCEHRLTKVEEGNRWIVIVQGTIPKRKK